MIAELYSELYLDALSITDNEWLEAENGYLLRKERHLNNIVNNFRRDLLYKFDCNGGLQLEEKAKDFFASCVEVSVGLFPEDTLKQFEHTEFLFEKFVEYIK